MRAKKISALALIVAAAGMSLTACQGDDDAGASGGKSSSAASSSSTGGKGSSSDSSSGSGSSSSGSDSSSSGSGSSGSGTGGQTTAKSSGAAASGSTCKTDNLGFSAASAGVKNQIVVNLKNKGSGKCTLHGFPGVQLVGPDGLGDTGPNAARTDVSSKPTVTIAPGEETRFLLHYMPDNSGHGKTYTRLNVTPPNEHVSEITDLHDQTITVPASSGHAPDVYVDPVGYHTGTGK